MKRYVFAAFIAFPLWSCGGEYSELDNCLERAIIDYKVVRAQAPDDLADRQMENWSGGAEAEKKIVECKVRYGLDDDKSTEILNKYITEIDKISDSF